MDIYFTYEVGICNEFKPGDTAIKEAVSIVVAPLRVEGTEERLKVISGCNMWQGCRNTNCFYSSAAREKPKAEAAKKPKKS